MPVMKEVTLWTSRNQYAAAFQANFKGTEQEEEDDPQSDHISHYR